MSIPLLCSYWGGAQGLSSTDEQAHVDLDPGIIIITKYKEKTTEYLTLSSPFYKMRLQVSRDCKYHPKELRIGQQGGVHI